VDVSLSIYQEAIGRPPLPLVSTNPTHYTIFRTYINYSIDTICLVPHYFGLFERFNFSHLALPRRMIDFLKAMEQPGISGRLQLLALTKVEDDTTACQP
jgi:hypothetical protein